MIPKKIGNFERYTKRPNAISHGFLYTKEFITPLPIQNKRIVRVFLPYDYFTNPEKRYGVMYMSDGQNMVDKYTTAYGEWNIDLRNYEMMKEGYNGLIYVGFDCPNEEYPRMAEMIPSSMVLNELANEAKENYQICGEIYLDYILKEIKPIIDQTFRTIPNRDNTLFGGSSMGGLIAFYAGFYHQDLVSKTLCFSPGFILSDVQPFLNFVDDLINQYGKDIKMAFLSGGKDLETDILKITYQTYEFLLSKGFSNNQINLIIDSSGIHHEDFWYSYFKKSLAFLLDQPNH